MPADLTGVIPAAGRGVRAYPYTDTIPKGMLEVDGVPLVERNVVLLRDALRIEDVVIVVGYRGELIREHLGDGQRLGVRIRYVANDRLDLNLPYSIHLGTRDVAGWCCVVLADECYIGSNHADLLRPDFRTTPVACGVIQASSAKQVRSNYSVTVRDGRIVGLEEKPKVVTDRLMGTGTYLLAPEVSARLGAAFAPDPVRGPRDWTTWLGELARGGVAIQPFRLTGRYVNVNSRDDLNVANASAREATFDERATTLVYFVQNADATRLEAAADFAAHPAVDEMIVVGRRLPDAFAELGRDPKVRLLTAPPDAPDGTVLTMGCDAARGDVLLVCQGDGTFSPRDLDKFLVYLRDADLVVGTRTTRQMVEQGTNMRGVVRAAHVALAKLVEVAWWRFDCRFTDICCVYLATWASTYRAIRGQLSEDGIEVLPEIVIEVLRARRRIIEIPINYRNPTLETKHVYARYQTPGVFLRLVGLIFRKRLRDVAGARAGRAPAPAKRGTGAVVAPGMVPSGRKGDGRG